VEVVDGEGPTGEWPTSAGLHQHRGVHLGQHGVLLLTGVDGGETHELGRVDIPADLLAELPDDLMVGPRQAES
jgi:hypothetical protein